MFFCLLYSLLLLQQFQADLVHKKSLRCSLLIVTVRYISFLLNFIVSVVPVEYVLFFHLFHSLHLLKQFQADCVYKKSSNTPRRFEISIIIINSKKGFLKTQWMQTVEFTVLKVLNYH